MKIGAISNNFSGIIVNRNSDKKRRNPRQIQTLNMEYANQQLKTFDIKTQLGLQDSTGAYEIFAKLPVTRKFVSTSSDDGQSFYEERGEIMKRAYSEVETKARGEEEKFNALCEAIEANRRQDTASIVLHDTGDKQDALRRQIELPGMKKIAGYDYERSVLDEEFIQKVKLEKQGEDVKIPSGILFFGPTGNGKTAITKAIAEDTGCIVKKMRLNSCDYEENKRLMQKIRRNALLSEEQFLSDRTRTIIFIDELNQLAYETSPIKDEFFDFIKDCSEKYHCTVFASTNDPLELGIDFDTTDIFPIVMSIDPASKSDKLKIIEHYIEFFNINLDSKKILSRVLEKEKAENAIYTNGQIESLCDLLAEKLTSNSTSDEADKLMDEWFDDTANKPVINNQLAQKFLHDYSVIMGREEINED